MNRNTKSRMKLNQRNGRFDVFALSADLSSGRVLLEKSQRAGGKHRNSSTVKISIHKNDLRMLAEQLLEAAAFLDENEFNL